MNEIWDKAVFTLGKAKDSGAKAFTIAKGLYSQWRTRPPLDARGIPTAACPNCACNVFSLYATFDPEEYTVATYILDTKCAQCGTLLTAPTPLDAQTY